VPKIDVSTKPSDEEQLAHTVESMLKDEPENNEEALLAVAASVFFLIICFISLIEE
jgi:hypothetical protein